MKMSGGKWFFRMLFYLLDTMAAFFPVRRKRQGEKDRVLIVRPDGIGDFVLFTAAFRGIREFYPSETHEITLVASTFLDEIASAQPLADEVILVDRQLFLQNGAYRWKIMRRIRRAGYDIALNPVYSRVAMIDDAIIRVTRAPERIAWQGNLDNISKTVKGFTDRWYKKLIPDEETHLMELKRNARFVRGIGFADFNTSFPFISVDENWRIRAEKLLRERCILQPYYVVLPGTGFPPERAWPAEKYGELSRLLVEHGMGDIVVCGGAGDRKLGEKVAASARSGRVFDLTGMTTLGTLAALLEGAEAVIGSDTGGVHLAAAVGGKAVSILGGAFPGRFFPYQVEKENGRSDENKEVAGRAPVVVRSSNPCRCPNWLCARKDWEGGAFPCLTEIGVEEVFQALRKGNDDSSESAPLRQ